MQFIGDVFALLDEHEVRFYVIGGQAVNDRSSPNGEDARLQQAANHPEGGEKLYH
jgi:hypothetical protein